MTCLSDNDKDIASCSLLLKQDIKDEEEETLTSSEVCVGQDSKNHNVSYIDEQYCHLYCTGASNAYLIAKRPTNNNKCTKFFSYKIVQRNTEWYLWRSSKCLRTELQFDIACQFNYPQNSGKSIKDLISKKYTKDQI
ncbi:unnamed protein product [Enterobius vermicularis]|uniref:DUF7808 domain-containing protein n=1 Tax=Enterobius vermicularis TaxID=51028 RepID=A0A0N4UTC6_ENTVE|nr:unnamed protein product [Enterobius vermicularis]